MTILFSYDQRTGEFFDADLVILGVGYSGRLLGINNPDMEDVVSTGPIPRGIWEVARPFHSVTKGPLTFALKYLCGGGGRFGRNGFLIHGDNGRGDRSASEGCIVLSRECRESIAERWKPRASLVVV